MPLTSSTVAAVDRRTKKDPDFAAAVEAELQAMRIQQDLAALRNASGRIGRRPAVVKKTRRRQVGDTATEALSR